MGWLGTSWAFPGPAGHIAGSWEAGAHTELSMVICVLGSPHFGAQGHGMFHLLLGVEPNLWKGARRTWGRDPGLGIQGL